MFPFSVWAAETQRGSSLPQGHTAYEEVTEPKEILMLWESLGTASALLKPTRQKQWRNRLAQGSLRAMEATSPSPRAQGCIELFGGTRAYNETGVGPPQLSRGSLPESPSGCGCLDQHLCFILGQLVCVSMQSGKGLPRGWGGGEEG